VHADTILFIQGPFCWGTRGNAVPIVVVFKNALQLVDDKGGNIEQSWRRRTAVRGLCSTGGDKA